GLAIQNRTVLIARSLAHGCRLLWRNACCDVPLRYSARNLAAHVNHGAFLIFGLDALDVDPGANRPAIVQLVGERRIEIDGFNVKFLGMVAAHEAITIIGCQTEGRADAQTGEQTVRDLP